MVKVILLTVLLVAVSVVLLSVRLLFGRDFVKTHVDQSDAMCRRGIHCVKAQDAEARAKSTRNSTPKV